MVTEDNKSYFAPNVTFANFLATTDPHKIVNFYNNRIISYYFNAAKRLISPHKKEDAFAVGLICFASIDAIASVVIGRRRKYRINKWLHDNILEFRKLGSGIRTRVYYEFRCGLVHEAKIHNAGQFTYDINKIIEVKNDIIIINPEMLLYAIENAFSITIRNANRDIRAATDLSNKIKGRFEADLKFVKKRLCKNCGGTGTDPSTDDACEYCDGSGYDTENRYDNELERADDAAHFSQGEHY
ncbi:MAG: zinc finger-like domain-containing protein [Candidatus Micrarchaeales archaeon]|nr:zinc finger-like domain-containing protein [Candidatus Micrarchaeales archaeon]